LGGVGGNWLGPRDGPWDAQFWQAEGYPELLQPTSADVVERSARVVQPEYFGEHLSQATVETEAKQEPVYLSH